MENKNSNEIMVQYEVNGEKIKLTPSIVQQYIVGDSGKITLPEFKFFTELCKARKLNPFLKEVFCIKFGSLHSLLYQKMFYRKGQYFTLNITVWKME